MLPINSVQGSGDVSTPYMIKMHLNLLDCHDILCDLNWCSVNYGHCFLVSYNGFLQANNPETHCLDFSQIIESHLFNR